MSVSEWVNEFVCHWYTSLPPYGLSPRMIHILRNPQGAMDWVMDIKQSDRWFLKENFDTMGASVLLNVDTSLAQWYERQWAENSRIILFIFIHQIRYTINRNKKKTEKYSNIEDTRARTCQTQRVN